MNGAMSLLKTLTNNGVDVCFSNPLTNFMTLSVSTGSLE